MTFASRVSNQELSSSGKVTGDTTPASTQLGVLTKLRDADAEIETDYTALKTIFDGHDHNPATGTGGGGQQIGAGGERSIAANGIDNAALAGSSITGDEVQAGAVQTAHIADGTVERAQIGQPFSASNTIAVSGSWTFAHGRGHPPMYHIEADSFEAEFLETRADNTNIYITRSAGSAAIAVTIRYYA